MRKKIKEKLATAIISILVIILLVLIAVALDNTITCQSLSGVDDETGVNLTDGDLIQIICIGASGSIDPPDSNGNPTGDDWLVDTTYAGCGFPFETNTGKFDKPIDTANLSVGDIIYCRAWNDAAITDATYYGDSEAYTVTGAETEIHDFDTWSTDTEKTTPTPTPVFDTGAPANPYPSIFGTHYGAIKPNKTITVHRLYTYPCSGTGGHTESVRVWNSTLNVTVTANWTGYKEDWHNITFNTSFILLANETYNYTLRTGSYPQIHHTDNLSTPAGFITCTEFTDANGKRYNDWIPAIKLY